MPSPSLSIVVGAAGEERRRVMSQQGRRRSYHPGRCRTTLNSRADRPSKLALSIRTLPPTVVIAYVDPGRVLSRGGNDEHPAAIARFVRRGGICRVEIVEAARDQRQRRGCRSVRLPVYQ
jgi:hypothetical protein